MLYNKPELYSSNSIKYLIRICNNSCLFVNLGIREIFIYFLIYSASIIELVIQK